MHISHCLNHSSGYLCSWILSAFSQTVQARLLPDKLTRNTDLLTTRTLGVQMAPPGRVTCCTLASTLGVHTMNSSLQLCGRGRCVSQCSSFCVKRNKFRQFSQGMQRRKGATDRQTTGLGHSRGPWRATNKRARSCRARYSRLFGKLSSHHGDDSTQHQLPSRLILSRKEIRILMPGCVKMSLFCEQAGVV